MASKNDDLVEVVVVIPKRLLVFIGNMLPRNIFFYRKLLYWFASVHPNKFMIPVKEFVLEGNQIKITLENGEEHLI